MSVSGESTCKSRYKGGERIGARWEDELKFKGPERLGFIGNNFICFMFRGQDVVTCL